MVPIKISPDLAKNINISTQLALIILLGTRIVAHFLLMVCIFRCIHANFFFSSSNTFYCSYILLSSIILYPLDNTIDYTIDYPF